MAEKITIDEGLYAYASPAQLVNLRAIAEHGSLDQAAIALGKHRSTLWESVKRVKAGASIKGFAPEFDMVHPVPETHVAKGVSSYYNKDGKITAQWVKSSLKDEAVTEMVRNMVVVMTEEVRGKSPDVRPPLLSNSDLLVVIPMGDPHFGMYSWGAETGDDFDVNIAERLLHAAIDSLVASAPPAETAILLNLGDFFHADNQSNTSMSGHQLDADSRWAKVMQVGLRAMVYSINQMLSKHMKVIVRNVKGNHDSHSSFALSLALDAFFSNNPRVTVELSPSAFWYYRFGKVLIGSTHGDQCKKEALPGVMACDKPMDWGHTQYRYWMIGHVHHDEVKEFPGVTVESFRTLAAKDAWHAAKGYRSGRDMRCIIFHREYGEIGRHRCDLAMINDATRATA